MTFFNGIAHEYDGWYTTPLGSFADMVETRLAFSLFEPQAGMKVLDAGCGTGNFSLKMAQLGCRVTGVDISEKMLDQARLKASVSRLPIEFRLMDLYLLDFAGETFDAVFSMAAFEFIREPQKAFSEMMRVLKPGGSLLIGTINADSSWGRLYAGQAKRADSIFRHASFKTLANLRILDPESLVRSGECLFIPPEAGPGEINESEETRLASLENGGFIAALWRKRS